MTNLIYDLNLDLINSPVIEYTDGSTPNDSVPTNVGSRITFVIFDGGEMNGTVRRRGNGRDRGRDNSERDRR